MGTNKTALVLGGGGARGLAHFGLLKVFEQEGIQFDSVVGTSMGGIAAAAWATQRGMDYYINHIFRATKPAELIKIMDPDPKRKGLFQATRLRGLLNRIFEPFETFEQLPVPLMMNAVEVQHGSEIHLVSGDLISAMMATSAVPGVFSPVEVDGMSLMDGGVINNLAVDLARNIMGADKIVAVDVQYVPGEDVPLYALDQKPRWMSPLPSFVLEFYWSEIIMIRELTKRKLDESRPEIVIRPEIPGDLTMFFGFSRPNEAIAAGEKAAHQVLPEIKRLLE
jgi:NTE family protein